MPPQQPWWNYVMLALWPVLIAATVVGAIALWRIGTVLRRIAFHIERPPTHFLESAQATISAARAQAGKRPAIVFEPPPQP